MRTRKNSELMEQGWIEKVRFLRAKKKEESKNNSGEKTVYPHTFILLFVFYLLLYLLFTVASMCLYER